MGKRVISMCMILIVLLMSTSFGYCNSGPTYWRGNLNLGAMNIDEETTIGVESERLIFDMENIEQSGYSMNSRVSAEYQMINTSDDSKTVQMAFPMFISREAKDIKVEINENEIPYKVYISEQGYYRHKDTVDFGVIIQEISAVEYESRIVDETVGKMYSFKIKDSKVQGQFKIRFKKESRDTKLVIKGFNGWSIDDENIELSSRFYKGEEPIRILIMNGDIKDLKVELYSIGEDDNASKKKLEYIMEEDKILAKDFLDKYIVSEQIPKVFTGLNYADYQTYNLYARQFEMLLNERGLISESDINMVFESDLIYTLVYDVDFAGGERNMMRVSYDNMGYMDKTKTRDEIYTFRYLLSPAKHWEYFKNLRIEIKPNEMAPYLVESNLKFEQADGKYIAVFEELPEEDLSFSMYCDKHVKKKYNPLTIIIGVILYVLVILGLRVVKRKRFKERKL